MLEFNSRKRWLKVSELTIEKLLLYTSRNIFFLLISHRNDTKGDSIPLSTVLAVKTCACFHCNRSFDFLSVLGCRWRGLFQPPLTLECNQTAVTFCIQMLRCQPMHLMPLGSHILGLSQLCSLLSVIFRGCSRNLRMRNNFGFPSIKPSEWSTTVTLLVDLHATHINIYIYGQSKSPTNSFIKWTPYIIQLCTFILLA